MGRPRGMSLPRLPPDRVIELPGRLSCIGTRMFQVQTDRLMTNLLAADAGILQTFAELPIQPAVLHAFVEAIDLKDI